MPRGRLRFGLKVAQMGGTYAEIRDAWLEADRLGFDTAWAHDHLLNQNDHSRHEDEGWTILTALLVESDAPYLAPVPFRGKRNEPAHVALTVARLAQARDVEADAMGSLTLANTLRLFGLADAGHRP